MGFNNTYKNLFHIAILHSYFLNGGNNEYNSMSDDKKKQMLKNYDFENFIEIIPTRETFLQLKNNHLIFQNKKNIMKVGVKISIDDTDLPFVDMSLALTLNFIIKIKDPFFENYTSISLLSNRILYISNSKPADEPITFKYIPLLANPVFINDDYIISETSTKKTLELFEESEKRGVIGIISLKMQGDSAGLNILNNQKKIITPTPSFKIHFNNRKTFWKYIKTNSAFEVETSLEKPLTQNGFIEIDPAVDFTTNPPEALDYQYPNPSIKSIQKIATKTYSQIFI
jgi:glutaredoxin-related protein